MKTEQNLSQFIEAEDSTPDGVGDTLVALNLISVITDDLYSILGDDELALTADDQDAVLSAYETISEIHDRINPDFEFPSEDDYDSDDDGEDDFDESVSVDEAMMVDVEGAECKSCGNGKYVGSGSTLKCSKCGATSPRFVKEIPLSKTKGGKRIISKMREDTDEQIDEQEEPMYNIYGEITKLGFKAMPQPKDFGKKGAPTVSFGIPMRAGKFADSYFNVYFGERQAFEVDIKGSAPTRYDDFKKALGELKSIMGLSEAVNPSSILKWETETEYMFEMTNADSLKVSSIVENILPETQHIIVEDKLVFETAQERDEALNALLEYSKNVNEIEMNVIELGNVSEAIDEIKFKRLAQTGLVAKDDVAKVVRAMKQLEDGKTLTPAQKDLISQTFVSLIELVTGDTSVFTKIKGAL